MVLKVGIEPTRPKAPDFESGASASSTTSAFVGVSDKIYLITKRFARQVFSIK